MNELLSVRNLSVEFETRQQRAMAVTGVNYELSAGTTLAIVGESGSGKTVSCRALTSLLPANATVSGSVTFAGRQILHLPEDDLRACRGCGIAMIFQEPGRALNPTVRVGEQIAEVARVHGLPRSASRERALELLERVYLRPAEKHFDKYAHQLSGGMQQRAMIAIALAGRPKVLVADEPTRSLDVSCQMEILRLLKELQEQDGLAVILITHDLQLAAAYADEVLVLHQGRVIESGSVAEVMGTPRMPYTQALLNASRHLR